MQRDKTGNVAHDYSVPATSVSNRVRRMLLLRQGSPDKVGGSAEMESGRKEKEECRIII